MTDVQNLEAWAITQGYDPGTDYRLPEAVLPPGFLSPNFREDEFRCRCCGRLPENGMAPALIDGLQAIRDRYNAPVTINSGYRCPTHNRNVGGATKSQHLLGTAADIVVRGVSPGQVYADLDPTHPGGLGRYNTFTHYDVRPNRARWSG